MADVQSCPVHVRNHAKDDMIDVIHVFCRNADGKTVCLAVNPRVEDIHSIKTRLVQQLLQLRWHTIHPNDLCLVCNGKPLEDSDGGGTTLAEFGIHDGSTLFCSVRTRGGCFMVSFSILMVIMLAFVGSFCTCGLSLVVVPFLVPLLFVLPLFCL